MQCPAGGFTEPALVDKQEWREHAEKWRESIDADHGSPDGPGTSARYRDGRAFEPVEALIEEEIEKIIQYLIDHLPHLETLRSEHLAQAAASPTDAAD